MAQLFMWAPVQSILQIWIWPTLTTTIPIYQFPITARAQPIIKPNWPLWTIWIKIVFIKTLELINCQSGNWRPAFWNNQPTDPKICLDMCTFKHLMMNRHLLKLSGIKSKSSWGQSSSSKHIHQLITNKKYIGPTQTQIMPVKICYRP